MYLFRLKDEFGADIWINPAGVLCMLPDPGRGQVIIQGHGLNIRVVGSLESVAEALGFSLSRPHL